MLKQNNVVLVNPSDRDWTKHRFVLTFGAYGKTTLMLWSNSLEDALDKAIDWLVDHAPGYIVDEQVNEAYREAIAAGMSEEKAQEAAEEGTTSGGNCGNHILSYEWAILAEDPSRDEVLMLLGRK